MGYDVDEMTVTIGHGGEALERAKAALAAWKHFEFNWAEVQPQGYPLVRRLQARFRRDSGDAMLRAVAPPAL